MNMDRILLGHGSGGRLMHQLIKEYFVPEFDMKTLGDSAVIDIIADCGIRNADNAPSYPPLKLRGGRGSYELKTQNSKLPRFAFTTDSYVVSPIFFPGGNIGELAVYGTVNDLAMVGARPVYLSAGFIFEEGFLIDDFRRILGSMANAAKRSGVKIVAGDTKVVNKGKGDGIFINTSGIGIIADGIEISPKNIKAGDKIIVTGTIGSHGVAVMAERNGLSFDPPVLSDTAPLNDMVQEMLSNGEVHAMRDPTRGGLATTLKEMAMESNLCLEIREDSIPIAQGVKGASELLGLDPLYIANEGIFVAVVKNNEAEDLISIIRRNPLGKNANIIGEVSESPSGKVLLKTMIGGTRILDMLAGEQLPRIC
ncbi:MAG: hydrogenase expression/formation protein HypE [Nitrospirae bacterium]|nr:hydrogenase expression/formation protein HypE [Nitrospirota bacterium]